ncbi:MAG: LysR family transcriptional regulator [Oscillibacter sp.]|nr:LysR family transcriptional regulator [Oscillibacter sp.]
MELYQIRQLLAVAEYGSLSAAALSLHVSQPALTRSMQKMEQEFGVTLFHRTRNRVELNEAGKIAVEQARLVMGAAEGMSTRMRDYKRAQTTISIGSCAPGPMWILTAELVQRLSGKTITSEMRPAEALAEGLLSGAYQLIILNQPLRQDKIVCRSFVTEQLFLSLPPAHPLAAKEGIRLSELAGQTMLLYADLGVWDNLREEKMADIHFIVQKDREAFKDLVTASTLPSFTTNLTRRLAPPPLDRVEIPILDPEASIPFYLCALERSRRLLESIPVHPVS